MRTNPKRFAVAALLLLLVACSGAQIIAVIEEAVTIAEAAAAVTGAVPPQFVPYVTAALDGLDCAATEAGSTDVSDIKATKIASCLANAVAPTLPAGTPANIVDMVAKLAAAVQEVLATLPSTSTGQLTTNPYVLAWKASGKPLKPLSAADKAKLKALSARAKAAKAKLAASHPTGK